MPSEGYGISRTCNVHSVGSVVSIYTILFIIGLVICLLLPCPTLHLKFVLFLLHDSSHVCNSNSIGYNCMYGTTRCLILQITLPLVTYLQKSHSTHTFTPHFSHSELEAIVLAAVCLQFYLCTLLAVY